MKKIGIFGGSFNPPHVGHIHVITTVAKMLGLKKVHIIPTAQNPIKRAIEGATAEQRLEMTRLAFVSYGEQFYVDDREIVRGGKSYSIDTINELRKEYSAEEIHLVLGIDAFEQMSSWKDVPTIVKEANIIVVTRPGSVLPESIEELPEILRSEVTEFDFNFVELKSGRNIQFINIKEMDISGTDLRKRIRSGRNLEKFLPLEVEKYIKENNLYKPIGDKVGDYEKFTRFCSDFLIGKKSIAVRAFDLRSIQAPSEFTIVTSGTSTRHSVSLAENLIQAVKDEYGVYPQSLEGIEEGRWVLVDYGSLIVHVFYDYARQEYRLEDLWKKGTELNVNEPKKLDSESKQ
jgi:nicotinate-nucleotide adenylyltransferase